MDERFCEHHPEDVFCAAAQTFAECHLACTDCGGRKHDQEVIKHGREQKREGYEGQHECHIPLSFILFMEFHEWLYRKFHFISGCPQLVHRHVLVHEAREAVFDFARVNAFLQFYESFIAVVAYHVFRTVVHEMPDARHGDYHVQPVR